MTVRELIAELQTMDPDRVVIIQKDSEGNGYSPLEGLDDNAAYLPENTWSGEVKPQKSPDAEPVASDPDEDDGDEDDEIIAHEDAEPCVVLYPVN